MKRTFRRLQATGGGRRSESVPGRPDRAAGPRDRGIDHPVRVWCRRGSRLKKNAIGVEDLNKMRNWTSELTQGMGSVGRKHVLATCGALAALAVVAASPQLLGGRVLAGFRGLDEARPVFLWLAGLSFAASLAAAGLAWRVGLRTCGSGLDRGDAVARYCVGSVVNALTPARLGGAVRIGLFSRTWTGKAQSGRAAALQRRSAQRGPSGCSV